jgi:hypothetical protein
MRVLLIEDDASTAQWARAVMVRRAGPLLGDACALKRTNAAPKLPNEAVSVGVRTQASRDAR